jgi:hypothetical protein
MTQQAHRPRHPMPNHVREAFEAAGVLEAFLA